MRGQDAISPLVPEDRRSDVEFALEAALGSRRIERAELLSGGVSGALILRLTAAGRESVLRIEPERIAPEHRARHFAAMAAAAEAGAAPALRFADAKTGVCVMDYLAARPLADHPGGAVGLARGMGDLLAKVRAAAPFANFGPYPELISVLLARPGSSGRFAASDLAPCREGLERIAEALAWDGPMASTHNDVSPRNLIFDGARLWLVDWELAWLSDPLVDLAIASTELAVGAELEHELLASSFGRGPDAALLARLSVTRLLTRLAYGVVVFDSLPPEPDSLALALTPEGFRAAIAEGRLAPGSRDIAAAFARMSLAQFIRGVEAPGFGELLARAGQAAV